MARKAMMLQLQYARQSEERLDKLHEGSDEDLIEAWKEWRRPLGYAWPYQVTASTTRLPRSRLHG